MKLAFCALFFVGLIIRGSTANAVEILDEKPSKKYSIITMFSIKKNKMEKIIEDMKKKADAVGADAVILECKTGESINTGLLKIRIMGSRDACQGTAIKYK